MAFLGQSFDLNELPEGAGNFEPIPAGWYESKIDNAELKDTKNGDGQYIKIRFSIVGPTHQGRTVFANLNIRNASAKAEEIGRQQLGELMRAIGLNKVEDTDELIGGDVKIKLSIREAANGYDAQNEVKGFKSILSTSSSTIAKDDVPTQGALQPAKSSPPWARK